LIFLAFIVPVAIYLASLASLNRSPHPVMISGRWDFAGVLFATSGFLLLGGPAILTSIYDDWRLAWLFGQGHFLKAMGEDWYFWLAVWGCYFLIVLTWGGHFLYRRGRVTSIYNVYPTVFAELLSQVLHVLDIEAQAVRENRFVLRSRDHGNSAGQGQMVTELVASEVGLETRLEIDSFPFMNHVSLRWGGNAGALRSEIEVQLARALEAVPAPSSNVGAWLSILATILFFLAGVVGIAVLGLRLVRLLH
jgi:hypothetical protein